MDLGLAGKKALVTGGTRGIGRAIVARLAAEGASVAICARGADGIRDTLAEFAAQGLNVIGDAVDVTDADGLKRWIAASAEQLGGLDIVVPNASGMAAALGDEGWRRGYEIDILGNVHTVEGAMSFLQQSSAASIVAIGSTAALEFFAGVAPYNAVKAAMIAHMSNLASALAPKGIRVNIVSPGTVYFPGGTWEKREREMPKLYERALGANPMGRMGTPDEIANAVAFLASPAASFITGAHLVVDGGITRRVHF